MALKKTVITPQGFEAQGAYHRINGISIVGKDKTVLGVSSHKDSELPEFRRFSFEIAYDINAGNPFQQAYAYLKTTDAFKDAEDC